MLKRIPIIHPGEILLEDFLIPMKISQYKLAKAISVPPRRINEIVKGKRAITPDTALRFSKFFGNSAQQWLNLQNHYELEVEKEKRKVFYDEMEKRIENSRIHKSYRTKAVLQHIA